MPRQKTLVTATKYVFLDVVSYSVNRSVEAQTAIIATLNKIVRKNLAACRVSGEKCILLPTGDGLCIALLDPADQVDVHLQVSFSILRLLGTYNRNQKESDRRFEVRIGINESSDNLVTALTASEI
ncbi:MAG: hypothetical protein ACHBNF_07905 [Chromatiales bacterium]